jgi:replicative DNA helicase
MNLLIDRKMAMNLKRERIETEEERKLLISLITNTQFLKDVFPILKYEYFQTPYARKIFTWVKEFYEKYEAAPERAIQDYYNIEKSRLNDDDSVLIEAFLEKLEVEFESGFNDKWFSDNAIAYLRKRSLKLHAEKINSLVELDKIDEAELEQTNFKKVAKITSNWVNPHDSNFIEYALNDDMDKLMTFPGALGELMGPLCRGWLCGVQAGFKKGKSLFLQEIRLLGLLNGLRVAEINLEMSNKQLAQRHYHRVTALPSEASEILYPLFDCYYNQIGSCTKKERINKFQLYDSSFEEKPTSFDHAPVGYSVCTVCRKNQNMKRFYKSETWFTKITKEEITKDKIVKKTKAISKIYGDNFRLKCYPRFSASIEDIERDLELLEYSENFTPDILIVDYLQITRPDSGDTEEERLNNSCMRLAGIAAKRNILVCTAFQIKTDALKRKSGKMGDLAFSSRVYAHVDLILSINQQEVEKYFGVKRINIIAARNSSYNELDEVKLIEELSTGQSLIDMEWV